MRGISSTAKLVILRSRKRFDLGVLRVSLQESDHHGAGFELGYLLQAERGDRQQHVGLRKNGSLAT